MKSYTSSFRAIRFRIVIALFVSLLPLFAVAGYSFLVSRENLKNQLSNRVTELLNASQLDYKSKVIVIEDLLKTLSQTNEVRGETLPSCDEFLAGIIARSTQYANIGVADAKGDVICSAVPSQQKVNIVDRL